MPAAYRNQEQLLALWDGCCGLDRFARDDSLLSVTGIAPQSLGARNVALLDLRTALFDRTWTLRSECPVCGETATFDCDSHRISQELRRSEATTGITADLAGREVVLRAPRIDDLRAVAGERDVAQAAYRLLARCVDTGELPEELDPAELDLLGRCLEALDPGALLSFSLSCPACGAEWSASIDVGSELWRELQRAAESILIDVDRLARAYGWTEPDVLRLSPARRAAYLEMAGA